MNEKSGQTYRRKSRRIALTGAGGGSRTRTGTGGPEDFKSAVSAIPPLRHGRKSGVSSVVLTHSTLKIIYRVYPRGQTVLCAESVGIKKLQRPLPNWIDLMRRGGGTT